MGSYAWYYIFPIFIAILATFGYKNKKVGYLIFFLLFFFNIFRGDGVGNDTANYMDWNRIQYRGGNLEIGFTGLEDLGSKYEVIDILICRLVYSLELNPRWVITIYSLITFIFFGLGVKRHKANLSLCCLFYVLFNLFFFSLTAARQMAAVSILLYAYSFIIQENRNIAKFILFVLIAGLIHMSAIFMVLLLPLLFVKIDRRILCWIVSGISVFFIISQLDPLQYIAGFFNVEYVLRYVGEYSSDYGRSLMGMLFSMMQLGCYMFFYFQREGKSTDVADLFFLVAILLTSMFAASSGLIGRISYNILIFACVYLSDVISRYGTLNKQIFIVYALLLLTSIYGIGSYGAGGALINGYYLNF